jgi:hypothetical protein
MSADAKNDRPMEDQDEREKNEQGAPSPPTPGAPSFVEAIAQSIHEASNLFPRG